MKTYIYTILEKENDPNGNPRSRITVYRVKRNTPELLGEPSQLIGYRDDRQAAEDIILENEAGWSRRVSHSESGWRWNSVSWARYQEKIRIISLTR